MKLGDDLLRDDGWRREIADLAATHHVPGAQVGVLALGPDGDAADVRVLATGVTSTSTEVAVTPDTLFQYGSITKVWTATLVMQLVEEGALDLDTHVVDVLPEFTLADPDAARAITVRHLLTHTSGIDGDIFTDTGDGDECVERYVGLLRTAGSVTEPGGPMSYCNAGFVVAGRIIEVLRGAAWDDVLAERLITPLGLTHVITRARDAPLFRTAVGHLRAHRDRPDVTPAKQWMLPRALGPAGLITGSADALLRFGAAHLHDGLGLTGERILSAEAARSMRRPQVDLAALSTMDPAWCLGWHHNAWGAETPVAHGGGTIGQASELYVFPERGLAITVLTNSRGGPAFGREVRRLLAAELGLTAPAPRIDRDADRIDLSAAYGVYTAGPLRWELGPGADGHPVLTQSGMEEVLGEPDPAPMPATLAGPDRFVVRQDGLDQEVAHLRHGGRSYLYATRLATRVE